MQLKYRYKITRKNGAIASGMMRNLESLKHFQVEDGDKIAIDVTLK
jgi:hypothetical protein